MNTKYAKTIIDRPIHILVILAITLLVTAGLATWRAAAQEILPSPWRDEFDGALAEGWYWIDENPDKWSLTDQPGLLRIYDSPYEVDGTTGNRLLRQVAQGDFAIETRLIFEPSVNFQIAALVIYQDEGNFVQIGRAFCDIPDNCVGKGIYFDKVLGGEFTDGNFATQVDNPFDPSEAYLRLERRGDMVKAFYSHEGITWMEIGTHWLPADFEVNGVGLVATGDLDKSDVDIPADFDYFELTEGWGFLPEGFHDYDSGDVPSFACNAGGWAADPDDRAADLAIEINIDGTSLPDWLSASEYREDLDNAGVCVDGNCGFSTSLWGQVSSYEEHTVVSYAQDIPSGDWVQLSNSPKPLTCRTYDIYAYDPLTGETSQVTNLRESDEYNPSWSPNGKKVAYDIVNSDGSQGGIFITDLKTGISAPLPGAENGGNDAVWSPNGKWIAFDKAWTDTPHIYIVPAEGGNPKLVKENAASANWAPSGRRLVYQDLTDGSIRTAPVDGGKGRDTLVAAKGANPSWSPDGSWIAYEFNGDIWKVPVNVLGVVLGKPVQVTGLAASEGQPTWTADSQTIIYHAGLSRDYDLWSVPAAGGQPTWLTGAPEFGDYDPESARDNSSVAYASFSPAGQAPRHWVATFTEDIPAGTWAPGNHSYYFENTFAPGPTESVNFLVAEGVEAYDGYALLRPWAIQAHAWGECRYIDAINPFQATRFLYGWVTDDLLTYQEAVGLFDSMAITAYWDDGMSASLAQRHEIFPRTSEVDLFGYRCSFTEPPPLIKVQITDNWFEAQRFLPNTELAYQIYDSLGGSLLLEGVMGSDDSGTAGIWVGDQVDLMPGQYLVVSDGYSTKGILLEPITFDLIDTNTGHAEGTAPEPFGRTIWIGIGFPDAGWDRWVPTDGDGNWTAEFEQPIPANFEWIAARAFDADGDISEVRPDVILLKMDLRVNYGHDWVESFYEAGHEVVITVTDSEGNEKASATVFTEPKDFWGGEPGFQTNPEDWSPAQPDIQPYDWVYASVDNGVTAQVQIGEINGMIDLEADSIEGTINAPWFSDPVNMECFPWGAPGPVEMKFDAALPNGEDTYSCSWAGEWDIQYYQDVGVGYFGPDGHWVANAFFVRNPRFTVYPDAQWFDGIDWPDGNVTITVDGKCSFERESAGGFFNGSFPEECAVTAGDTVTFTDGITPRSHTVENLAIKIIDKEANTVSGEADSDKQVFVWAWYMDGTTVEGSNTDVTAVDGGWLVDYDDLGIDLVLGIGIQAEIRDPDGNATSVDLLVPDPRIVASITENWFYVVDFIPGEALDLTIYADMIAEPVVLQGVRTTNMNGFAWINFDEHGVDLEPGSILVVSDGTTTKDLVVEWFTFDLFDLSTGHVAGTVPGFADRPVWIGIGFPEGGWDRWATTDADGNWEADFDAPVPANFTWVAAQIFDEDGDASELRPAEVRGQWVAIYQYDLPPGAWAEGGHNYYLGDNHGNVGERVSFTASGEAPLYDGFVLLRGWALRANTGDGCQNVDTINPAQPTRFHSGWLSSESMTYEEAVAQFSSLATWVVWDGEDPVELVLHDIRLYSGDTWWDVVCTFTE